MNPRPKFVKEVEDEDIRYHETEIADKETLPPVDFEAFVGNKIVRHDEVLGDEVMMRIRPIFVYSIKLPRNLQIAQESRVSRYFDT